MKQIAPDVWQIPGPALRMPGGVHMPLASTLLRLADRSLLLYSPVKLDDAQAAAIDALGTVKHIVAPNLYHHLYLKAAHERWPNATVHAPPGLAAKRSDIAIGNELSNAPIDGVEVEVVGGAPKINEALLFHRPSGALLCGDLVFNVTEPANARTRFVLALMGTGGKQLKMSRMWSFLGKDKAALRTSIDRVLAWPIASVVPAHGEAVTITATELAPKLARARKGAAAPAGATGTGAA